MCVASIHTNKCRVMNNRINPISLMGFELNFHFCCVNISREVAKMGFMNFEWSLNDFLILIFQSTTTLKMSHFYDLCPRKIIYLNFTHFVLA